jgi:hypothetical protein
MFSGYGWVCLGICENLRDIGRLVSVSPTSGYIRKQYGEFCTVKALSLLDVLQAVTTLTFLAE